MPLWIIVSGIIAPAVFWAGYFYYKDRFQPEPIRSLGIAYLLGFVAAFACLEFYRLLPFIGLPDDPSVLMEARGIKFLGYSLGAIGLVEELFKFLPFLIVVFKFKDFDERIDGIIYASTIALGFASFENINYLKYMAGFQLFGRAFASPLTHTIFSSIWGYTVGTAQIRKKSVWKGSLIGIVIAALVHGIFNFLTVSSVLRAAGALLILVFWVWRIRIMEKKE